MCDLLGSQLHWSDDEILDKPLRRLRQAVAAVELRLWEADLAARRLATVQLRTICAFIASTIQVAEGEGNPLIDQAGDLDLGPGTETVFPDEHQPHAPAPAAPPVVHPAGAAIPHVRISTADLPDAPPSIKAGQPTPGEHHDAAGLRAVPYEKIAGLFGGAL